MPLDPYANCPCGSGMKLKFCCCPDLLSELERAIRMFEGDQKGRPAALFLMVGFCGGFTTFSAFSLQTLDLMQQQAWLKAGGNVVLSVAGCLLGTWLGFLLGQAVKKSA